MKLFVDQKEISGGLNWKVTEVPILPRKDCKKKFRETRVGPWFKLDRSFICAGGEGNSCNISVDLLKNKYS